MEVAAALKASPLFKDFTDVGIQIFAVSSFEHGGKRLGVNVSVGFAPFPLACDGTPLSWERAVNLVDMALYLAKSGGRNRVVRYTPD